MPWSFDKALLLLRDPSFTQPSQLSLKEAPFWVRVYDLPIEATNMATAKAIGEVFGGLLEVDETQIMVSAKFLHIRVMVQVENPFRRGVILVVGGKKVWAEFKYDRLPNFCYVCGCLGHVEIDYEDAQSDEEHHMYGDALRASPLRRQNERDHAEQERERELLS